MNKKIIKFIVIGFILGLVIGFYGYYLMPQYWPEPKEFFAMELGITKIQASYAADYSNDEVLMGASHNVFIAKIIKQIEVRDYYIIPNTMFEAEIISNLKGNLGGKIIIGQEGGGKDGLFYIMDNGIKPDEYFLKPGSTYMLATRYSPGGNWHLLNFHPNARKKISSNPNSSKSQLESISQSDPKVQALREAYKHEVLLGADVYHNNTLNSYKSLHPEAETPIVKE